MTAPVTLYEYSGIVRDVHDGDTIRIDIDLGFKMWRYDEHLRLWGINAPEVIGASKPAGLKARDALREKVLGKSIVFRSIDDKQEKFGRYLAILFDATGLNVNEWMVASGYAVRYMEDRT